MNQPDMPANPFRPGAGQKPLYLAGRTKEQDQFRKMLRQNPVSQNVILTGLRGVGKTVLLDELKPIAQSMNWLWTGNDLSESASLTEERIARRITVDIATLLSPYFNTETISHGLGFQASAKNAVRALEFSDFWGLYENTPGLVEDKLKAVLNYAGDLLESTTIEGIVFAYDEAQNLTDHAQAGQFPLSMLLDVFSYLQRRTQNTCKFMLLLCGLPTLFPKLNEARTYTERMFHVMHLEQLDQDSARKAILKPIEISRSKLRFTETVIHDIIVMSGGYPYFLQFICKDVFDAWIGKIRDGEVASVPQEEILAKLDQDFFSPRWMRATDRQQEFMQVIASLENHEGEFSVQEIVNASRTVLQKGFSPSHATQMLKALTHNGLIYKNKRGGYRFAVPLMARFIRRQP